MPRVKSSFKICSKPEAQNAKSKLLLKGQNEQEPQRIRTYKTENQPGFWQNARKPIKKYKKNSDKFLSQQITIQQRKIFKKFSKLTIKVANLANETKSISQKIQLYRVNS